MLTFRLAHKHQTCQLSVKDIIFFTQLEKEFHYNLISFQFNWLCEKLISVIFLPLFNGVSISSGLYCWTVYMIDQMCLVLVVKRRWIVVDLDSLMVQHWHCKSKVHGFNCWSRHLFHSVGKKIQYNIIPFQSNWLCEKLTSLAHLVQ